MPIVHVYLRVRPTGARYDLGDILVNGAAIVNPAADLRDDVSVRVPDGLISDPMILHARVRAVSGTIRAALFAWSSVKQDDPNTDVDERWERIAVGEGSDPIDLDGEFKPF